MIEPKIEIAPEKYWIDCTYPEIKMYLFCLNIDGKVDWRLPTNYEQDNWYADIPTIPRNQRWVLEDLDKPHIWLPVLDHEIYVVVPVRDLT